jgi:hypothetical protein
MELYPHLILKQTYSSEIQLQHGDSNCSMVVHTRWNSKWLSGTQLK